MKTKHTKGEWSVDGFNTTSVITNINGYTKICDCHIAGIIGNDALQYLEENKANAKLIAAAPELLEALIKLEKSMKETHKMIGSSEADLERFKIVKNAINKAIK